MFVSREYIVTPGVQGVVLASDRSCILQKTAQDTLLQRAPGKVHEAAVQPVQKERRIADEDDEMQQGG